MIKKYNSLSFVFGVPGILLRFLSFVPTVFTSSKSLAILGFFSVFFVGTALLLAGLGYYAKSRGRSWTYCFFAFLGIIGLIVLMCLKDLTLSNQTEANGPSLIDQPPK
jgi:predicted tellurium resistance membrane protein TerC